MVENDRSSPPGRPTTPFLDIGVFGARGIPSTYSGYETFLTALLPHLTRRGHRVTMYCRKGATPPLGEYEGVRCVQLPSISTKQLSTLSHGLAAALRARIANHDVLLVVNVANAAACMLCRFLGQPVVLNTDGQEWLRGKWGAVGRGIFLSSAKIARWSASAIVADCCAMQRIYVDQFRTESTVIPYCWTDIRPRPDAHVLDRFGLPKEGFAVIAGRLTPENQIGAIASAYARLDPGIPLVVLGAANYRSPVERELQRLADRHPDRVKIGGHIDDRATFATLLARARVYLHGHTVGGINPSLIEAMGCGGRILAVDTAFNREAVADCGDYFSSTLDDLDSQLTRVLAESGGETEVKRAAARVRAATVFSLADVSLAYERLVTATARQHAWRRTRLTTAWESDAVPVQGLR